MTQYVQTFFGEYRFLSNFWPCQVEWEGILYPSAECAYQAAKSPYKRVRKVFAQITSSEAKQLGKLITIRDDWEAIKLDVMYEIVFAKFSQNPELEQLLLGTGDAYLEEGNHWGDRFWGVCPVLSNNGQNHLGKILMRVRNELRMGYE